MDKTFSKAVILFNQTVQIQARLQGMIAENQHRLDIGTSIAYGEEAFRQLEIQLLEALATFHEGSK